MREAFTVVLLILGAGFALVTVFCAIVHLALAFAWVRWREVIPEFHYPGCLLFALGVFVFGQYRGMPEVATAVANYVALFGVGSELVLMALAGLFAAVRRARRGRLSGRTD